jgi:cytochrome c2
MNIAHTRLISGRYASFTLGETGQVLAGMRLIGQYACRRCHVIANRGNRLAASLDLAPGRKAPPELVKALMQPVAGMPDFRLDERQQTAIINALQWAALIQVPKNTLQPQTVHFSTSAAVERDLFSRKCGPCHRILSLRHGVLGQGDIGPNLSGLFSPFYPQGLRASGRWTETRLASWLENPRIKRSWAMMQPVELTKAELTELVSIMLHEDRGSMQMLQ